MLKQHRFMRDVHRSVTEALWSKVARRFGIDFKLHFVDLGQSQIYRRLGRQVEQAAIELVSEQPSSLCGHEMGCGQLNEPIGYELINYLVKRR